jgi:hypothetical protein
MKGEEKKKAIELRKKGLTYSEILKIVPVAKSTLSLWLRSVNLSKRQSQKLTRKKLLAARRGGEARRKQRRFITKRIKEEAMTEISSISERDLLLIGTALHWAEGSKNKESNPSVGMIFSNSDSRMIRMYIKWLEESMNVLSDDICFEVFIHENRKKEIETFLKYWSSITGFPVARFDRIYFKRDKRNTKRKNVKEGYYGLLRVKVRRSTNLNRKIEGFVEAICYQCGVV